ncbi:MAG: Double zinc ribbon [Thermoplasmata archaeon]|nr:Double zinc ribbon [Thermoplasmata archaeon]
MPRKAPATSGKGKPKAAATTPTTPCPRCAAAVPVRGERGACPSCGLAVRFVDAVERPCSVCGKQVAFPPGQDAAQCGACGAWQAADPSRPLEARAACPRCGRDVVVPVDTRSAPCPRCGAMLALGLPMKSR